MEGALSNIFTAHSNSLYRLSPNSESELEQDNAYFSKHMTPTHFARDFMQCIDQPEWIVELLKAPDAYEPFTPKRVPILTRYSDRGLRVWESPCTYKSFIETCKTLLTQDFPTFIVDARSFCDGAGSSKTRSALGVRDTKEPREDVWKKLKALTEGMALPVIQIFRRIVGDPHGFPKDGH